MARSALHVAEENWFAVIAARLEAPVTMSEEGNYVDSHGQSEIGFGITRLLNIDLLPRIKRMVPCRMAPSTIAATSEAEARATSARSGSSHRRRTGWRSKKA